MKSLEPAASAQQSTEPPAEGARDAPVSPVSHASQRRLSAGSILAAQRSAGNAAVTAMLARQGDHADAPSSSPGPVCEHPVPDVPLFDAIEKTWPLFGESTEVEVWRATVELGWLGYLDLVLRAGASAEASLLAGIGPGVIRNICLGGDPAEACVTGTAEVYVPAQLAPDLKLEGSLRGSADYLGSMPLAALKGAATAAGRGTATSDLIVGVTVAYEDGKVSFDADADLSVALELLFALDASLSAELFGEEAWGTSINLVDWRWNRTWPILGRVGLGMSQGTAKPPRLEFNADQLSLPEVLRGMLDEALDPAQILAGLRGSSVGTASPMLDPTAALVARAAIEANDLAMALDVVVRSLPIDTSQCTISFVDDSSRGEGLTTTDFNNDGVALGPSRVSIYRPAFASVPWLVSSVMHEYQHVLQHHSQGASPEEFTSEAASTIANAARDTEAYLWEIEHSPETGLFERPEELRDVGQRLMANFELLGTGDRERQERYRERVDAAMEFVDGIAGLQAPPMPKYANIFHHGTDYDTAEALATADIGAIGGNDFGRGFYTHSKENWKLAKEWAVRVSRGKRGWGVVTFPVPDDVWKEEIVDVMIFENPRHQPDNIPINPDTGKKFRDWREFVNYNKRFRRDRLPEWPELQVIIGPLWGRYENNARVRQVVFTSTGVPVLNRPESKAQRIVFVRRNPRPSGHGP